MAGSHALLADGVLWLEVAGQTGRDPFGPKHHELKALPQAA